MTIMDVVNKFHQEIDYEAHQNCKLKHHTASNCIECCSQPYYEGTEVDYSCEQKRKLYVVRYAPAYASEVYNALSKTPRRSMEELYNKPIINIASLGGGPGTDIAACKRWLSNNLEHEDRTHEARFLRVDINNDWAKISPELIKLYDSEDLDYHYARITADLSKDPINSLSFDSFDIILISYLISELNPADIINLAKSVLERIKEKAIIIINDRRQEAVIEKIESFIKEVNGSVNSLTEPHERDHCGESYPDEIFNAAGVTIFKKSIRYNVSVSCDDN